MSTFAIRRVRRSGAFDSKRIQFPQRGVSLIELMIALALGVIFLLGITQVFSGVRMAFGTAEGLSRLQENSRFAMQFLRFDTRMVGHFGCRNEAQLIEFPAVSGRGFYNHTTTAAIAVAPAVDVSRELVAGLDTAPYTLQMHRPIQIYDYELNGGTSPGDVFGAALAEFPGGVGAANAYRPVLPAALTVNTGGLTAGGLLGGDDTDPVPGSDILVMRYFNENSITLPGGVQAGTLTGSNAADFPQWRIFGVADCATASLFQITNAASPAQSIAAGVANLNRRPWGYNQYGVLVPAYAYEFVMYYVGRTSATTAPALFRRRLLQNPASAAQGSNFGPAEELISGVEMMQVLVGVDTESEPATPTAIDSTSNEFRSATDHLAVGGLTAIQVFNRERSINSVRVSLMIRSPEPIGTPTTLATRVVGDVTVTPPVDQRMRHVYDSTMTLRNRVRN